ncbi:Do family serine endopeptidase [Acidimangrovimonas pyrenivorans]|uniref:Do family serine endopeptidase n=1 Tax=Acidimangrovimonas pyrenivorans TaxID=2030798 RepID=A0ABV7AJ71_9RHOB
MKRVLLVLMAVLLAGAAVAETVPTSRAQIDLSFAPIVREAAPAVVNIYARRVIQQQSPFANDPYFGELFRQFGDSQPRVQNSLGSGVILSPDGLVVSNYHVVGQATQIRVALNDRREFKARVVLADRKVDLAVLKLEGAHDLPALPLRDSDKVEVGELVLAIGNPFGIGQTVSSGIISGLARSGLSIGGAGSYIQTDAAINPGNSGGALVDMAGRLVGINSSILSRSGGSNGIGFAIPANLVKSFVAQARSGAKSFRRPWAGISAQSVSAGVAESLGLNRPHGVLISEINPASPFAKAGLRHGDVVLKIGGEPVNSPQEMLFRMTTIGVGATARVDYLHRGQPRTAAIRMIAPPETPPREALTITSNLVFRGLSLARINPAVIAEMGLPQTATGVVVTGARDLAAQIGLERGDILLAVNGQPIERPRDVTRAAQDRTSYWAVDIQRGGRTLRLRFRL